MNSMFTRHSETLDASELIKKRKNMVLFDTIANSNKVCIKDVNIQDKLINIFAISSVSF